MNTENILFFVVVGFFVFFMFFALGGCSTPKAEFFGASLSGPYVSVPLPNGEESTCAFVSGWRWTHSSTKEITDGKEVVCVCTFADDFPFPGKVFMIADDNFCAKKEL